MIIYRLADKTRKTLRADFRQGDERYSLEWINGIDFPVTRNIRLRPQCDLFLFKGQGGRKIASNLLVSVNLSYARLWKFQYQKFFRAEEKPVEKTEIK